MKKLGSIFMAIAIFVTSCFSNLGVVFAATTFKPGEITASKTASVIEKMVEVRKYLLQHLVINILIQVLLKERLF